MLKLPNLEKNSFLSILIKNGDVYANLAYVDYNSGRNYIFSDVLQVSNIEDILLQDQFWVEYFDKLARKFNWQFFREREIMNVVAEGIGLSGIVIYYANKKHNLDEIISKIRDVSLNIEFVSVDSTFTLKLLKGISQKLNYKDVLYINVDIQNFSIFRVVNTDKKAQLDSVNEMKFQTAVAGIDWDHKGSLVQNIHNSKLKAFLSLDLEERKLANTWANFVSCPVTKTNSPLLRDIVRSYISVQLITMINEGNGKFDNIGNLGETLVIIGGNLVDLLNLKELSLALLDGLELRGNIDLQIDRFGKILTFGTDYILGIAGDHFVFSTQDLMKDTYKLVVGEIKDSKQSRKVVFSGKSEFSEKGAEEIYAFSPEINVFDIENRKGFVSGKFIQGAYWGEGHKDFEVFSDPGNVSYKALVVDCRPKPIVYGPDSRTNRAKLSTWINEIG